jgi:hypothetical protein
MMKTDDGALTDGDESGMALLDAELAELMSALENLKAALTGLVATLRLQLALELRAPPDGDQSVRWN